MNIVEARDAGKKIFVIIDGKSIFYRGYYAMPNLSTPDGTAVGGVYGFASLALEIMRRLNPDYVAVAWDKPKTNIRRRKKIYAGYKANRHPAPPDFYTQLPILNELLKALNWPLYEYDDYEADDIMGTLSQKANDQGIHTILVSSDLDMLQLIDDDTEVYALKKGLSNLDKFDVKAFENKYGIKVNQFLDLKSLKGDSSDNIPGVRGVGEKTATSLLQKYHSLDGVYNHLDEITGSLHDKLAAGEKDAYMSRELALIQLDAPVPLDLKATDVTKLDRKKLHDKLLELRFTSLIERLPEAMRYEPDATTNAEAVNNELPDVKIVSLPDELKDSVIVVIKDDAIILSDRRGVAYQTDFPTAARLLINHKIIGHNLKSITEQFLNHDLKIGYLVGFDTQHAGFLINSLEPTKSLTQIFAERGITDPTAEQLVGEVWHRWHSLQPKLAALPKLYKLATTVDFPLQIVLAKMEKRGVLVDPIKLAVMSDKLADDISKLERSIWNKVGYEFNISSPKQLSVALFEKMNIPPVGKRKKSGSYSTSAKVLAKLSGYSPVIEDVTKYRELSKLKSTYVDALPNAIAADGRIHTTFDQDITSTGRLSSSNPNLQNIPTRSERGREIKAAFIAPTGRVIINADYAQFELRLAAAMAGDQNMINMFADPNNDIHTMTAAEAYGVKPEQVTPIQRRHAKVINFGVLYGMSPRGLSDATGMTFSEAKKFIERYFEIRKPIRDFIDRTLKQADEIGYVETMFGRRRPTPDVKSSNFMVREAAKRAAANMPIQGTEADLMKMAMLKIEDILGADQIMQVHDSIMVECNESDAKQIASEMKNIMENIYPNLGVKLFVDIKIGHSQKEI